MSSEPGHKGFSEETCVRCGWRMGSRALNCQNDNTPHVFPSQVASRESLRSRVADAEVLLGEIGAGGSAAGLVPAVHNLIGMYEKSEERVASLEAELAQTRGLSDPDANVVGKHQRPGAAADTQRASALHVFPRTGTARRRVLDLLSFTYIGYTDEEIQMDLDMNPSTERPRRVELVEGGWVKDSGQRRNTTSRTPAVVWVLTEKATAQMKVRELLL